MEFTLDMSMMFAMHDALRRELVQVARIAGRRDDHPGQRLRALVHDRSPQFRGGQGDELGNG